MRSEETLSARGKKRERHTGKKRLWRPEGGGPSPQPVAPPDDPRGPAASSPHMRARRRRPLTGTTRVCEHGKFLPAPWRTTQDSPFPGTGTQSAGSLGVPGMGTGGRSSISCTGGHNMDTNTHQRQAVRVQAAVPGEAGRACPSDPSPPWPQPAEPGEPRGPSPAAPGSPEAPAFLAGPHPRARGRLTGAGAGLSSWKRPSVLHGTTFLPRGHILRPPEPTRAPSHSRGEVRAPRWNFLAGSSCLRPDTLLPPPGPGPHRQPGRPLPGPRAALLPAGRGRRIT